MAEIPDVSDPDIREMVLRDHQPEEVWSVYGKILSIHCRTCLQAWPCPSIKAARKAERDASPNAGGGP